MYSTRTGLVLGFHGCDESVVMKVLTGEKSLKKSTNNYDWLGYGAYFGENSPSRAMEFATHLQKHPNRSIGKVVKPAVIGAVIDWGYCLDLLDYSNLQLLSDVQADESVIERALHCREESSPTILVKM